MLRATLFERLEILLLGTAYRLLRSSIGGNGQPLYEFIRHSQARRYRTGGRIARVLKAAADREGRPEVPIEALNRELGLFGDLRDVCTGGDPSSAGPCLSDADRVAPWLPFAGAGAFDRRERNSVTSKDALRGAAGSGLQSIPLSLRTMQTAAGERGGGHCETEFLARQRPAQAASGERLCESSREA